MVYNFHLAIHKSTSSSRDEQKIIQRTKMHVFFNTFVIFIHRYKKKNMKKKPFYFFWRFPISLIPNSRNERTYRTLRFFSLSRLGSPFRFLFRYYRSSKASTCNFTRDTSIRRDRIQHVHTRIIQYVRTQIRVLVQYVTCVRTG